MAGTIEPEEREEQQVQDRLDEAKGYEAARGASFHKRPPSRKRKETSWPIRDPDAAMTIWAEFTAASGEPTLVMPKGLDRTGKTPDGLPAAETQLARFVEETQGFEDARPALCRAYIEALPWGALHKATRRTVRRFLERLDTRLPWAPETAAEEACSADVPEDREPFPAKRSLRSMDGMVKAA